MNHCLLACLASCTSNTVSRSMGLSLSVYELKQHIQQVQAGPECEDSLHLIAAWCNARACHSSVQCRTTWDCNTCSLWGCNLARIQVSHCDICWQTQAVRHFVVRVVPKTHLEVRSSIAYDAPMIYGTRWFLHTFKKSGEMPHPTGLWHITNSCMI